VPLQCRRCCEGPTPLLQSPNDALRAKFAQTPRVWRKRSPGGRDTCRAGIAGAVTQPTKERSVLTNRFGELTLASQPPRAPAMTPVPTHGGGKKTPHGRGQRGDGPFQPRHAGNLWSGEGAHPKQTGPRLFNGAEPTEKPSCEGAEDERLPVSGGKTCPGALPGRCGGTGRYEVGAPPTGTGTGPEVPER